MKIIIKSAILAVVPLLAVCLMSCSHHTVMDTLRDVDSFIQERPDSALTVLESIDAESLASRESRARYSLLYVTALDKNYIDTTDLDIILPAYEYFVKRGPGADKMRTLFYQGRIYENRKEYDKALHCYFLALDDSSRVDDNRYKFLVNSAISDVFRKNHNPELELKYASDALKYGRLVEGCDVLWATTGQIASCYAKLDRWKESKEAYDKFFAMPVKDSLTFFRRKVHYAESLLLSPKPDPQTAVDELENIARCFPKAMSIEAYCIYALAQQKLGNETVADDIIRQLESMNSRQDYIRLWRYRILREQGKYDRAISDLEETVRYQDTTVRSLLRQSILQAQYDYAKSETLVLKKENELERQRILLLILVSLSVIGLLTSLHYRKKAELVKKIEALTALQYESQQMLDLQNMETKTVNIHLAQKEAELLSLRRQFASMYKAQYKSLNSLCAAYLSPIKKDRKDIIYAEAMNQLRVIVNDENSHNDFMSMVNASLDGILDKLRKDLPKHKEQDFRFLMYVIVGFDATTISCLTGYSIGSVYTKKNRLKTEISNLSSAYRDFYLEFIN